MQAVKTGIRNCPVCVLLFTDMRHLVRAGQTDGAEEDGGEGGEEQTEWCAGQDPPLVRVIDNDVTREGAPAVPGVSSRPLRCQGTVRSPDEARADRLADRTRAGDLGSDPCPALAPYDGQYVPDGSYHGHCHPSRPVRDRGCV